MHSFARNEVMCAFCVHQIRWLQAEDPKTRPSFSEIIERLEAMEGLLDNESSTLSSSIVTASETTSTDSLTGEEGISLIEDLHTSSYNSINY